MALLSGVASGVATPTPIVLSGVASGSTALMEYAQERTKPTPQEDIDEIEEQRRNVNLRQDQGLALSRLHWAAKDAAEKARQEIQREAHMRKVNEVQEARRKEEALQTQLAAAKQQVLNEHGPSRRANMRKALSQPTRAVPAQEQEIVR
jgi:hypothetical protein